MRYSAAYSLSGQINITLSSSASIFDRRRTVQLLLQSLVVTWRERCHLVWGQRESILKLRHGLLKLWWENRVRRGMW